MKQANEKYVIAHLRVPSKWVEPPGARMTIECARKQYDLGQVDMAQGWVRDTLCLFAIPRRVKEDRRAYFYPLRSRYGQRPHLMSRVGIHRSSPKQHD